MIMASHKDSVGKPRNWDKAVSVAHLRNLGYPQVDAAKSAKIGLRTLQHWERCSWWSRAKAEAAERWAPGTRDKIRGVLDRALDRDDVETARWMGERLIVELAPPRIRTSSSIWQINLDELDEEELEAIEDCETEEDAHRVLAAFRKQRREAERAAAEEAE